MYVETFLNNLVPIYTFSQNEITSKLESNESQITLADLRLQLLPKVGEKFPEYANKTPIGRTSKKMICKDIFILGFCIVENSVHKDLESVYRDEPAKPQLRVEDVSDCIKLAIELQQEVQTLRQENADNKREIADNKREFANYKKKSEKDIAELKSEINRVKAKCDQGNSAEEDQPVMPETTDRPNTAQEDEIHERNEEVNGLLTVDNNQPENHEPQTITPAPNKTDLFIGNVGASHSCADIKRFINTKTNLQVELKDIQEKAVRGDRKAFKVSVPYDKAQEAVSIWPREITAERYMAPSERIKPAKPSNTQARTNGTNRNTNNNRNNRHNNSSGNNRDNNRGNAQIRQNGSNRNQRRRQAFQDQVQNRYGPPSTEQYFQPRGNLQYPIPSTPPIPNQYWNQYRTPSWLPQPFFNF